MDVSIRYDQGALDRLFNSEQGHVGRFLLKKTIQVERAAKRLCPVDTGRLRSSITHSVERDGRGLVGFVGTNVEYAIYVEFGTRYMRAQPFLRPALRAAA